MQSKDRAFFLYHQINKENDVKFMHQSLCNPPISSLLKAINAGFLKGAPHLSAPTVRKYLMPSPATSKGHMKRPRKGLCSTTPKKPPIPVQHIVHNVLPRPIVPDSFHTMPSLIPDYDSEDDNWPQRQSAAPIPLGGWSTSCQCILFWSVRQQGLGSNVQ